MYRNEPAHDDVDRIRMPLSTEIRISTHFDTFSIDYRFYSIGHMSFVPRTHPPLFSAHLIRNMTSSTHSRQTIFELSSLSAISHSKPSQTFENSFYTLRSSLSSLFRILISSFDPPTHSSCATFDVSCVFRTCYHMQV